MSCYLVESESDEESQIVMKRRRMRRFLDDDSDEEQQKQRCKQLSGCFDNNGHMSDDYAMSPHSFESTRTEVVNVVQISTTAADLVDVDKLSKDGGSTPARIEDKYKNDDDSDDSISLLDSADHDVRPPNPDQFADSDETCFTPCRSPLLQVPLPFTVRDSDESLNGDTLRISPAASLVAVNETGTDTQYSSSVTVDSEASAETENELSESNDYSDDNKSKEPPSKSNAHGSRRHEKFSDSCASLSSSDEEDELSLPLPNRYGSPHHWQRDSDDADISESEYDDILLKYNPACVSHAPAKWQENVQEMVTMMNQTLEGMPLPEDKDNEDVKLPPGISIELYPHQKYAFRWLNWREGQFPGGGILADEMGLGKTVEIISLIMKKKWDARKAGLENIITYEETRAVNCIQSRTTLIVCPVSVMEQWRREMDTKGRGYLSVHIYHGKSKLSSAEELAKFDVVLSTFQTIASVVSNLTDSTGSCFSVLRKVFWVRIVLDEAHTIRNPKTKAAQALCQLEAKYRWVVTGTPIHNKPEDFFSMCRFLRLEPLNDRDVWDVWIGLRTVVPGAEQRLHVLGKALILRRTKDEVGSSSVGKVKAIPPKTVQVVDIELKEEERQIYDMLKAHAQIILKAFLSQKKKRERRPEDCPRVIKFSHIFTLFIRLRQCAVLPYLIKTALGEEEITVDEPFDQLIPEHILNQINPTFNEQYLSSKFETIIGDVDELRLKAEQTDEPMEKVIIVSCWTSTLDIIYQHLQTRNYQCVFITGREDISTRLGNMDRFNKNKLQPQVLLLSLIAGGVGLNLVGANHVFFVEPHWNPQHELQAQDRAHRFGQTKNVFIRRYIAEDTIENRIMGLQQKKLELAQGLLSNTKNSKGVGITLDQIKELFDI